MNIDPDESGFFSNEAELLENDILNIRRAYQRGIYYPGMTVEGMSRAVSSNRRGSGGGNGGSPLNIRNEAADPLDTVLEGLRRGFEHGAEDITRRR